MIEMPQGIEDEKLFVLFLCVIVQCQRVAAMFGVTAVVVSLYMGGASAVKQTLNVHKKYHNRNQNCKHYYYHFLFKPDKNIFN